MTIEEAATDGEEVIDTETDDQGAERPRDEHGRFVSADKPEEQTDDPAAGIEDLRRQIAAFEKRSKELETARDDQRRAFEIERRAREEAERRAARASDEAVATQHSAHEARYDAILNALAAANSQLDQHQSAYTVAMESGEYRKAAELSAEIGKTAARIQQLDAGKAEIESRNRDQSGQRQVPQETEYETRAKWIANLPPKSAAFIRANYDRYFNDRAFASMVSGAHNLAVGRGLQVDSDEYMRFVEEQTGVRQPEAEEHADSGTVAAATASATHTGTTSRAAATTGRKSPTPAAPAAGTTGDSVRNRGSQQITLTAEEREFCKLNDIPEGNYAKQKRALMEEGRVGPNAVH